MQRVLVLVEYTPQSTILTWHRRREMMGVDAQNKSDTAESSLFSRHH